MKQTLIEAFVSFAPTLKTYYDDEDNLYYCEYLDKIVGSGEYEYQARNEAFENLKIDGVIPNYIFLH